MIPVWHFVKSNWELAVLGLILIVVIILFISEFNLKSGKSWIILISLSALGGFVFYQAFRKNKLLAELEKREKELRILEEKYNDLFKRKKITEENYKAAKAKLDETRMQTALDILKAEEKYKKQLEELEREINKTPPEVLVLRVREILNKTD